MSIEGEIRVTLGWDGARVQRVTVRSTRPSSPARVAVGRTAPEAAALLPALHAVCGGAQAAAAHAALRAAGAHLDEDPLGASVWPVVLEAVQEGFWRLLIDLPRALELDVDTATVAEARGCVAAALRALRSASPAAAGRIASSAGASLATLARAHVHGVDARAWLEEVDLDTVDAWKARGATLPARAFATLARTAPGLGRSDTPLMPDVGAPGWESVLHSLERDGDAATGPTWDGTPVETGPLARRRAHPLVAALLARDGCCASTRIAARVVDLAAWIEVLRHGVVAPTEAARAWPLPDGSGVAAVQTARGLLLHRARVHDGRVADYRIVAPTDWNFHPEGALARGLLGLRADDEAVLAQRASLAVLALDPCVASRVEVTRDA